MMPGRSRRVLRCYSVREVSKIVSSDVPVSPFPAGIRSRPHLLSAAAGNACCGCRLADTTMCSGLRCPFSDASCNWILGQCAGNPRKLIHRYCPDVDLVVCLGGAPRKEGRARQGNGNSILRYLCKVLLFQRLPHKTRQKHKLPPIIIHCRIQRHLLPLHIPHPRIPILITPPLLR